MKTKTLIYGLIFLGWALIIGSYFIDSPIYSDFVSIIFLVAGAIGVIYFLIMCYVWLKGILSKKR
jgi:ABC-type transport system involved in multi-copper enzyme maturation permease subunit